jgi:hypothetical protein
MRQRSSEAWTMEAIDKLLEAPLEEAGLAARRAAVS